MPYCILPECVGCGTCQNACGTEAIVPDGWQYKILVVKCIDCGSCKNVCPVDAIEKGPA